MAAHQDDATRAFAEETNRLTAERIPIGVAAFVLVFGVAWILEHGTHPERDWSYALMYGLEVFAACAGLWLSRRARWRDSGQVLAAVTLITLVLLTGAYNVLVRGEAEVLTIALLYLVTGGMVLLPWGWQGQLPVALAAVVTYAVAVRLGVHTATSLSMHLLGVGAIGALTVGGAAFLARQRWAVLRQAAALQTANAALAEANQALADANQTKNEFLANVSHELRTPLNIMLGYTDLLVEGEFGTLPGDAHDTLERIGRTCRTLVFLISDLLDLSRIEAGRLAVRPTRVELAPVFAEMTRFVEPRLASKDVRFHLEPPGALAVIADRDRLEQILVNLLSNAAKFTQRGDIRLRAQPPAGSMVSIEVCDTGAGIDGAELATVFEPFRQGVVGKQLGGVGIGLSLSSRLAQAMGGQLSVSSEWGRGSTFVLQLPAAGV